MGNDGIFVNLIAYPVKVLGYGERVGLWTQGCSIGCNGCMSRHTWDFDKSKEMSISEIVKKVKSYKTNKITISGGEPFQQKNILDLLKAIKKAKFTDVMLYSGYTELYIREHFYECLSYIDVLITEPFIDGDESDMIYKGSENQKMIILNEQLRTQYEEYEKLNKEKKLQKFDDVIVGIPYQRDIKALYEM